MDYLLGLLVVQIRCDPQITVRLLPVEHFRSTIDLAIVNSWVADVGAGGDILQICTLLHGFHVLPLSRVVWHALVVTLADVGFGPTCTSPVAREVALAHVHPAVVVAAGGVHVFWALSAS